MRITLALLIAISLTACAATDEARVSKAAVTPLNDFNLANAPIPQVLQAALKSPYALPAMPAAPDCAALALEVAALDAVLGPDVDAAGSVINKGLGANGEIVGDVVGDEAASALQRTAEGIVPFRGWIRKLSGAERRQREVAAAIAAGAVRRGFLKGVRAARSCT